MTLTAKDRDMLNKRATLLNEAEQGVVELALSDLKFRADVHNIPVAGDERLAALEAALIRYIVVSRDKGDSRPDKHDYTETGREGKWEVKVSPTTSYGYFEHDEQGEGGGLWFSDKELTDYDGRSCLPRDVAKALIALGYTVDPVNYTGDPL